MADAGLRPRIRDATYLEIDLPREDQLSGRVGDDPLTDDLARRRILLNLPERW